jgi:serine/threonine-protein kinase
VKRLWRRVKRRRWAVAAVGAVVLAASGAFAAASYLGPEPERVFLVPDPDARLKEIQAELATGKSVTLIGPTGLPRWHRWALAPATLGESLEVRDHTCGLQTMERSLLELVQDPGTDRYRLTAEVRHDRSPVLRIAATAPGVGAYFGYRYSGDADREEHRFFSVDLSEYPINRPASSAPNPRGARWRYAVSIREDNVSMPRRHEVNLGFFPVEAPAQPMPWRTIVVTVTPTAVRVEMPLEPDGEAVTKTWEQVRRMTGQVITPRSPLGIYASSSLVSVRNVILEPLP